MKRLTLLIAGLACAMATSALAQTSDANGDGKFDKAETLAGTRATFESLDTNKDGRVSLSEINPGSEFDPALIGGRRDTAGFTLESMLASSAEYFDRQDANKDGFVTRDEIAATTRHVRETAADGKVSKAERLARTKAQFERLDTDKDGKNGGVTLEEALAGSAARFDASDTNKDGFLDQAETRAAALALVAQRAGQRSQ